MLRLLRIAGELLVTAGVVMLGFVAYMYWGTALKATAAQQVYAGQLARQWSSDNPIAALTGPNQLPPGTPFALLRIPQLGRSWQFIVVQGAGRAQLALAPGHVAGTPGPGQIGNFVVAGYRVTAGSPFRRLLSVHRGSKIEVETIDGTYVYEVAGDPVLVAADYLAVIARVPPEQPRRRMITLITCDQTWARNNRLLITGVLVEMLPRPLGS